jgi:hypothetical protein
MSESMQGFVKQCFATALECPSSPKKPMPKQEATFNKSERFPGLVCL